MLFLNKSDLFEKKIDKVPLSRVFKSYDEFAAKNSGSALDVGKKFMQARFSEQYEGKGRLFVHYTNALDRHNCKKVFESVRDELVQGVTKLYDL